MCADLAQTCYMKRPLPARRGGWASLSNRAALRDTCMTLGRGASHFPEKTSECHAVMRHAKEGFALALLRTFDKGHGGE
jgi:hypothetical protein